MRASSEPAGDRSPHPVASRSAPLLPAYYWAGQGSAIIHRMKGFTLGIDQESYARAYDGERLRWLRDRAGVDLLFLSYSWGLPPEIEQEDWTAFAATTEAAHRLGMRVIAYVQPSNAAYLGSYRAADWWAIDPLRRRVPYYAGRFFTCLSHPDWRATLEQRVDGALAAGADGIFLDNCVFGSIPIPLGNDYTGFAGCFCIHCHASFRAWQSALGRDGLRPLLIPRVFRPSTSLASRRYAEWRADVMSGLVEGVRSLIRERREDAVLLTNTFGAVTMNTYNLFGVDLPRLASIVDWFFVENLQAPRASGNQLVQNAGTFKLLQGLNHKAPALSISYERGIGVDNVPAPPAFARAASEAYAAGGIPVLRACEYVEHGRWTLLRPGAHDAQLDASGRIVRLVREHPEAFEERSSAAGVALYVPEDVAWQSGAFPRDGGDFVRVIQALVSNAIPFRIVSREHEASDPDIRLLIVPDARAGLPVAEATQLLRYSDLRLPRRGRTLTEYFAAPIEPLIRRAGPWWVSGYFAKARVRRFVDRLDLIFRLFFRAQFAPIRLPTPVRTQLELANGCRVRAERPVYADLWCTRTHVSLHLVNYASDATPVGITSRFGPPERIVVPEGEPVVVDGRLLLQSYGLVLWNRATIADEAQ